MQRQQCRKLVESAFGKNMFKNKYLFICENISLKNDMKIKHKKKKENLFLPTDQFLIRPKLVKNT